MMSASLAVLQDVLVLAVMARCLLVLQSYSWRWYWLLWHDVCWSCSLTVGAGIGCYGTTSAGLAVLKVCPALVIWN